jgi:nitroreductase
MIHKKAYTNAPLHELLATRWSPRAFDPKKRVSREQIISLCEAARWAPSSYNDQPWKYIIWDRYHDEENWQKAFDCLGDWNKGWVKNAPVLIVAISRHYFKYNGEDNKHGEYDTGAASENLCLQATALGLMAHQMAGFNAEKLKETFGIPDELTPKAMIAAGYQTDESILKDDYVKDEKSDREREPLGVSFFDSAWEKPIIEDIAGK